MNRFSNIRGEAGYTQEALAAALGVERSTVGKWETGAAYPRIPQLRKIAELLNCTEQMILDALEQKKNTDSEFYTHFLELCANKGVSPTRASLDAGCKKGSVTYWKKQHMSGKDVYPDARTVQALADYFGVSTDYLLGRTNNYNMEVTPVRDEESRPAVTAAVTGGREKNSVPIIARFNEKGKIKMDKFVLDTSPDQEYVYLTIKVPAGLFKRMKLISAEADLTMSNIGVQAITYALNHLAENEE